jgi:hypothetical protein
MIPNATCRSRALAALEGHWVGDVKHRRLILVSMNPPLDVLDCRSALHLSGMEGIELVAELDGSMASTADMILRYLCAHTLH